MSNQFAVCDAARDNLSRLKDWVKKRKNDASFPTESDWQFIEESEKELKPAEKIEFREELFQFAVQRQETSKASHLIVLQI